MEIDQSLDISQEESSCTRIVFISNNTFLVCVVCAVKNRRYWVCNVKPTVLSPGPTVWDLVSHWLTSCIEKKKILETRIIPFFLSVFPMCCCDPASSLLNLSSVLSTYKGSTGLPWNTWPARHQGTQSECFCRWRTLEPAHHQIKLKMVVSGFLNSSLS